MSTRRVQPFAFTIGDERHTFYAATLSAATRIARSWAARLRPGQTVQLCVAPSPSSPRPQGKNGKGAKPHANRDSELAARETVNAR